MVWVTGTSNDRLDLLTQLRQVATGNHVATAAISAGGTGYTVGDILTATGGTFSHAAKFEVLTVSSGVIQTLRISEGGAYTSNPSSPVSTTGGTGTGATVTVTFASTGWTVARETEEVTAAVINAAGTGYSVNDKLTVVGGLGIGSSSEVTAAVLNVDTVGGSGEVTGVSVDTAGIYEEPISPTTGVAVTGGGGSGATFDLTFAVTTTQEKLLVMTGANGGGGDDVTVAIKTFTLLSGDDSGQNDVHNWALFGMPDFNAANLFQDQASLSPGLLAAGGIDTTQGAFMVLKDNDGFIMNFWMSVTDRRVILVAKVETAIVTHYVSMHLGFLDQLGTATEQPYPIYIAGCASRHNAYFSDTSPLLLTGLTECVGSTLDSGPAFFRRTTGTWQEVRNSQQNESSGSRSALTDHVVYPCGLNDVAGAGDTGADPIAGAGQGLDWSDFIDPANNSPFYELRPTPNTTDDLRLLVPATLVSGDTQGDIYEQHGEMNGVFWFSLADAGVSASSEDF